MKILYHHRIRSKDGQFVHLEEMVNALRVVGHKVTVCGPNHVQTQSFGSDAGIVDWMKRRLPRAMYESLEFAYAIPDFVRIARSMISDSPDIIYERFNLFLPSGIWASAVFGKPLLLEVNAPLFEERSRYSGGVALEQVARWSQHYAWRKADHVLPVTEALSRVVAQAGVPSAQITVVHNGINPGDFDSLPAKQAAKDRLGLGHGLVIGFVGFMRDWHGLDRIVRFVASRREAGLRAVFVGDGPVRSDLESLAARLGIHDRLTITGIVDRHEIPAAVAAFDIALQPAVVEYASPLKLFEYLAAGLPVVAPSSPNIVEILRDGSNALLFRPNDEADFARQLARLCDDAELRGRLGCAARNTIESMGLTWADNARRVTQIAERLLEEGKQ
jgi:glycosyltransferase involved in cell wall biosynthesis